MRGGVLSQDLAFFWPPSLALRLSIEMKVEMTGKQTPRTVDESRQFEGTAPVTTDEVPRSQLRKEEKTNPSVCVLSARQRLERSDTWHGQCNRRLFRTRVAVAEAVAGSAGWAEGVATSAGLAVRASGEGALVVEAPEAKGVGAAGLAAADSEAGAAGEAEARAVAATAS